MSKSVGVLSGSVGRSLSLVRSTRPRTGVSLCPRSTGFEPSALTFSKSNCRMQQPRTSPGSTTRVDTSRRLPSFRPFWTRRDLARKGSEAALNVLRGGPHSHLPYLGHELQRPKSNGFAHRHHATCSYRYRWNSVKTRLMSAGSPKSLTASSIESWYFNFSRGVSLSASNSPTPTVM